MKKVIKRILKTSLFDCLIYIKRMISYDQSKKIARNYLKLTKQPKLQIGCGQNLTEGWLNTDLNPVSNQVAYLDASKKFPFDDNTFDFIYSEHIFEHLIFKDSCNMISECFRVLKSNGVMRLALPHIDFLFNLYQNPTDSIHKEYIKWATERSCVDVSDFYNESESYSEIYVINNFFKDWGHQIIHSFDSLKKLLLKLDFTDIQRKGIGISEFEEMCNMEKHGNFITNKFNALETLVVEAKKRI